MTEQELKNFLDEKYLLYNHPRFIETDPLSIPRLFSRKEDIEIAGFLAATIAWGQRPTIIRNASKLMDWMDNRPFEFITQNETTDFERFDEFVHRTFNGIDCRYFLHALREIYRSGSSLETLFTEGFQQDGSMMSGIVRFREKFLSYQPEKRTLKHVANPLKGSSAKRINMFLRWMVRDNSTGVDFGLWKDIPTSALMMPLDVHSGNVARKLGLLKRKQNDWKAVDELTSRLRDFDRDDPVKYDFALFGLGVFEKF
ncbi:TIGR02757 family protein [Prolixibacter denitrificans]|jgi:uncharacterized protein (TIGR02757 family)|uniref:TIGR02757 family protein n=1 Tax=Prolixibacter denitrificans TaxID=1541063 RepID=A0A2P8CKL0_9BACT|nr:TIGR02757 family protein [Prolixibacter denitrificans]PSK85504.1 uncharacterized protein (TIGR02757 family) [Prolixibacter denitrificans]GET20126.1 TIGR02757 family protein [Prolixibacter denitrificans]